MTTKSQTSQGSSSSSYSSESSLNISRSGDDTATDWKERCVTLEGAMVRYREKVTRIRQVLADKVSSITIHRVLADKVSSITIHQVLADKVSSTAIHQVLADKAYIKNRNSP